MYAVIMAGGSGTRFWPVSRQPCPKQLLQIGGTQTLLQAATARLENLVPPADTLIITHQNLVETVRQLLPDYPQPSILGEPCRRNTAPCIALAAALLLQRDAEATMLVMPADHLIDSRDTFQLAVQQAEQWVQQDADRLVTFGIKPSYPAESFGYIQSGNAINQPSESPILQAAGFEVKQFCEKPPPEVAAAYLDQGGYFWNSGIFLWQAQTILAAIEHRNPNLVQRVMRIAEAYSHETFEDVWATEYESIKGQSIDYAVMEDYNKVVVMEAPFQWNDVGSWQALEKVYPQDENNNTIIGKHISIQSGNNIIWTSDDHLVATVGMRNCIIVHTTDATLVANKDDEEAVRNVVALIQSQGWDHLL